VGSEDPYELRRILVCARLCPEGHIQVDRGSLTIDGLKLKPLPEAKQKKLNAIYEEDFKEEDSE